MLNALSIDVEEGFQATEVAIPPSQWPPAPPRVEPQTNHVLEILESRSVKATFFLLGWVAEHNPRVVSSILAAGHEIGCHSYSHRLVYSLTPEEFRKDTLRATEAIEAAGGVRPRLYRAPSYSITRESAWALEILAELGFTHDSSIYPISHDRYGIPGFGRHARNVETPSGTIREVPIATVDVLGSQAPVGGGGYLRLLPYRYTAAGLRRINRRDRSPACVYFHPWELDPDQPHLAKGAISRLRTYWGLGGMTSKLHRLLSEFEFSTLSNVFPADETGADGATYADASRNG